MASTLLPFLYQTQTLRRGLSFAVRAHAIQLSASTRVLHSSTPGGIRESQIPFELPDDLPQRATQDGKLDAEYPAMPSTPESTITPTEQQAFDLIFREIAGRRIGNAQGSMPGASNGKPTFTNSDPPSNDALRRGSTARRAVGSILGAASRDLQHIQKPKDWSGRQATKAPRRVPLGPTGLMGEPAERELAIQSFPAALQESLRLTLGKEDTVQVTELFGDALGRHLQTTTAHDEVNRRAEQERIETLMRAAPDDFALWQVLEAEVFPLVQRLGLDGKDDRQTRGSRTAQTKSSRRRKAKAAAQAKSVQGDETALKVSVYGPLYPSLLLLALRMFDTGFGSTSPLAHILLPRIKNLGLASWVLGATTPFYNQLASMLWRSRSDVTGVLALFEEARQGGLLLDHGSLRIINGIRNQLAQIADRGGLAATVIALRNIGRDTDERLADWSRRLRHWVAAQTPAEAL
jgi:hypothetical protein